MLLLCGLATGGASFAQTQTANEQIPAQLTPVVRADVAERYAQMLAPRRPDGKLYCLPAICQSES